LFLALPLSPYEWLGNEAYDRYGFQPRANRSLSISGAIFATTAETGGFLFLNGATLWRLFPPGRARLGGMDGTTGMLRNGQLFPGIFDVRAGSGLRQHRPGRNACFGARIVTLRCHPKKEKTKKKKKKKSA